MLGARETGRDYRLVVFEAYDGTYYIHLSLQGPDRDDGAASQVATSLASEVYATLGMTHVALEPEKGIEPLTCSLRVSRSAD